MFSGLRTNSLFYILEKGEKPVLKVGQVSSVSNPSPKYGQYPTTPMFGQQMETVVDVSVKVGDETMEFKQLPSNLSIANRKSLPPIAFPCRTGSTNSFFTSLPSMRMKPFTTPSS